MTAEQAILGCMINDVVIAKTASAKLRAIDFIDMTNRRIFESILQDITDGLSPDIITITRRCKDLMQYILELSAETINTYNYMAYIQAVIEDASVRQLHEVAPAITSENESIPILENIISNIKDIQSRTVDLIDYSAKETVNRTLELYEAREAGKIPGIDTPLNRLTYFTGGWQQGDLVIIGARPSIGKTAFALACTKTALEAGKSILFFSLEMSRERIMDRLLVGYSGCDIFRYKSGKLNTLEKQTVRGYAEKLADCNLYVIDRGTMGLAEIEAFATARKREDKCDMIIIDYLQLMKTSHGKNKTRDGELSEVSRGLKLLAKELNVPVIALSQLNREVEKRADKKPMLADLRESGAIEQDADLVLLLYRAAFYGIQEVEIGNALESSSGLGELIIAKHRNGETGVEYFRHNDSLTRIYSYNTAGA